MATTEVTRYDIELNTIPLGKLTSMEMNLFFSIITQMRDKGTQVVRFYFDELRELSEFNQRNNAKFLKAVRNTYQKLLQLNFGTTSKNGLVEEHFVIFSKFTIHQDVDRPYIDVKVFEDALPLLNNLDTWVRYSLHEFNSIKSTYAKTLFRLLKQFRTTGYVKLSKTKFNELLDVPKSYRTSEVNKRILNPAEQQLAPYFKNLVVEKERAKTWGNPIKNYIFKFTPEKSEKFVDDKFEKKSYQKPHQEISTNWESHIPKKEKNKEGISNKLSDLLGELD